MRQEPPVHRYCCSAGPHFSRPMIAVSLVLLCMVLISIGCDKKEEKAAKEKVVNVRTANVEK